MLWKKEFRQFNRRLLYTRLSSKSTYVSNNQAPGFDHATSTLMQVVVDVQLYAAKSGRSLSSGAEFAAYACFTWPLADEAKRLHEGDSSFCPTNWPSVSGSEAEREVAYSIQSTSRSTQDARKLRSNQTPPLNARINPRPPGRRTTAFARSRPRPRLAKQLPHRSHYSLPTPPTQAPPLLCQSSARSLRMKCRRKHRKPTPHPSVVRGPQR